MASTVESTKFAASCDGTPSAVGTRIAGRVAEGLALALALGVPGEDDVAVGGQELGRPPVAALRTLDGPAGDRDHRVGPAATVPEQPTVELGPGASQEVDLDRLEVVELGRRRRPRHPAAAARGPRTDVHGTRRRAASRGWPAPSRRRPPPAAAGTPGRWPGRAGVPSCARCCRCRAAGRPRPRTSPPPLPRSRRTTGRAGVRAAGSCGATCADGSTRRLTQPPATGRTG